MRVVHVITRLIVGGAQENTIATVLGLRNQPGLSVELLAGPTTGPEGSLEECVTRVPGLFTRVPELVRPVNPWRDWKCFRKLTAHFRERRPDLVHTHSGKAGILGRLAARKAGVPVIVHTIHGPSFGSFQGPVANGVFRGAERMAGRATTHFVSVAQAMSDQYLAAGIGRPEQYTRIFSGFDLQPFLRAQPDPSLREQLGIKPHDFVIGKIARLFANKGHEDLISIAPEIVRRIPNVKFLIVGDGERERKLRRRILQTALLDGVKQGLTAASGKPADLMSGMRTLPLDSRFIFAGLVSPSEVPDHLALMDVVVHLSRREGLARVLPQALAAGKPVVALDCDGAGEVCVNDETGFLIPPGDMDLLVKRLVQLHGNRELRERLAQRGRTRVLRDFSVEKMVNEIHALYRQLSPPAR